MTSEICEWIYAKGGLTVPVIFELVDSYLTNKPPVGYVFVQQLYLNEAVASTYSKTWVNMGYSYTIDKVIFNNKIKVALEVRQYGSYKSEICSVGYTINSENAADVITIASKYFFIDYEWVELTNILVNYNDIIRFWYKSHAGTWMSCRGKEVEGEVERTCAPPSIVEVFEVIDHFLGFYGSDECRYMLKPVMRTIQTGSCWMMPTHGCTLYSEYFVENETIYTPTLSSAVNEPSFFVTIENRSAEMIEIKAVIIVDGMETPLYPYTTGCATPTEKCWPNMNAPSIPIMKIPAGFLWNMFSLSGVNRSIGKHTMTWKIWAKRITDTAFFVKPHTIGSTVYYVT